MKKLWDKIRHTGSPLHRMTIRPEYRSGAMPAPDVPQSDRLRQIPRSSALAHNSTHPNGCALFNATRIMRIIQRNGDPASNSAQSPGCVERCAKPKPRRITRKNTGNPDFFQPQTRTCAELRASMVVAVNSAQKQSSFPTRSSDVANPDNALPIKNIRL